MQRGTENHVSNYPFFVVITMFDLSEKMGCYRCLQITDASHVVFKGFQKFRKKTATKRLILPGILLLINMINKFQWTTFLYLYARLHVWDLWLEMSCPIFTATDNTQHKRCSFIWWRDLGTVVFAAYHQRHNSEVPNFFFDYPRMLFPFFVLSRRKKKANPQYLGRIVRLDLCSLHCHVSLESDKFSLGKERGSFFASQWKGTGWPGQS